MYRERGYRLYDVDTVISWRRGKWYRKQEKKKVSNDVMLLSFGKQIMSIGK